LLDLALVLCLIAIAAELIPLPPNVRTLISPAADRIERSLVFDLPEGRRPLSLDPAATAWALVSGLSLFLIFWSARSLFARGGAVRIVSRWIGWFGLALAIVMFLQRSMTPGLIYGLWTPITRASNPTPLGPFVNRNDIATWLMIACPIVFGYLIARVSSTLAERGRLDIESLADSRTLWLTAAVCFMLAALLASLSRSGLFGATAAACVFAMVASRRVPGSRMALSLAGVGLLIAAASFYVNVSALAERISNTLPSNLGGRLTVWHETWPMTRDFPLTGIGVGAFERAMLVYQQSTRLIFFNHAHNEYLQVLVEGGWLLAVPAILAAAVALWSIVDRLRSDRTPIFWIRLGAASGLAAVAAQSVWDTGLRMPANAVLFAVAAAAAMFRTPVIPTSDGASSRRTAADSASAAGGRRIS
jgi:O-antigen ligase/polysaccharide polymerase Wzy-like membrane protein